MSIKGSNLGELIKYAESLKMVAENKVNAIFPNLNHQHAAIAICTIMDFTKEEFILFDDNLENDIVKYDEVKSFKKSFEDMLDRRVKTTIIISDKNSNLDDVDLVRFFKQKIYDYSDIFSMKLADSNFKSKMYDIYNEKINFAIGDDDKFRLELFGNKDVTEKRRTAYISFNNEDYTKKILSVVNTLSKECNDYFNKEALE